MPIYKTSGLVLKRTNLGEADRIITFFTPDYGKLKAVARGVRKIRSRQAGHLELFCEVDLMLAVGRNLDVVASARLLKHYSGVSSDYSHLRLGYLMAEMTDKLTGERSPQPAILELLRKSYQVLDQEEPTPSLELGFKLKLLDLLGYRPNLDECLVCHRPIKPDQSGRYFFNFELGGIVDGACSRTELVASIKPSQIKSWRQILTSQDLLNLPVASTSDLGICDRFYDYVFGVRFKSGQLLPD